LVHPSVPRASWICGIIEIARNSRLLFATPLRIALSSAFFGHNGPGTTPFHYSDVKKLVYADGGEKIQRWESLALMVP
jgi:hypothetical protein